MPKSETTNIGSLLTLSIVTLVAVACSPRLMSGDEQSVHVSDITLYTKEDALGVAERHCMKYGRRAVKRPGAAWGPGSTSATYDCVGVQGAAGTGASASPPTLDGRSTAPPTLRTNSTPSAPHVSLSTVQRKLAYWGYYKGPIDGAMGRDLRSAIKRYQTDSGILATGNLDAGTLAKLGIFE